MKKIFILGLYSPKVELQYPLRENFPGIKRVENIADGFFDQFLERILLWLDLNGISLNFMKYLFSKDSLQ